MIRASARGLQTNSYVGKLTGLYPTHDHLKAALIDEIDGLVEEVPATTIAASTWDPVTGKRLQGEARLAARTKLAQLGSPVHHWLARIDASPFGKGG